MPEAPELAHSRDRLKMLLSGKRIADMSVGPTGRYLKKSPEGLEQIVARIRAGAAGPLIEDIGTRGKFMWWKLQFDGDHTPWYMHCTYGMSGGWFKSPSKHTAFVVAYATRNHDHHVFFNDPRHFGTIKFVAGEPGHTAKLATLGPCILGGGLTPEIFAENILRKHTHTIAEALMDQRAVAGIGNYLRAEILYTCGVNPWRNVTDLSSEEYVSLCEESVKIAESSYRSQGASIKTYRNVDGSKGTTQFTFKVYDKKNCPLGHEIIRKRDLNGRTMHWCPMCQK